jgi:hypothetical protein
MDVLVVGTQLERWETEMTVVSTLDVMDLTASEYRTILDELGVEEHPAAGIYLHVTLPTEFGFRIIEIWDHEEGFEDFVQRRLRPAAEKVGIEREMNITIEPLHNLFGPRLAELPGLVSGLPGAPHSRSAGRT